MEYQNSKGQTIGTLKEGIFRKIVDKKKHLMKIYDAWGIQYTTLISLRDEGCTEIRIKDTRENTIYSIPFRDFYEKAHVADHGDGEQAFCERMYFTVINKKEETPLLIRNQKEDLISQIVEKTNETNKKALAGRIAIAYNTLKWTEMDLHALLAKANDPAVNNYTAFVKWSCTIKG